MEVVGIRQKSTGNILAWYHFGEMYLLPEGVSDSEVDIVTVVIPEKRECPDIVFLGRKCSSCGQITLYEFT